MQENCNTMPRIGAFVLETLTTGMYSNALDTLREYVQNSFDAIRDAKRTRILTKGEGRIRISIDEKNRNLTIRDNGTGILRNNVYDFLVNIGMSSKSILTDAGFRGIGRLAGIAYCEKLIFLTQASGELDVSSVSLNCIELRNTMSSHKNQKNVLIDVINSYTAIEVEKTHKNDHFFEVKMEGINEEGQSFLEWKQIENYLCQVAPVGLDTQSFPHAETIINWLEDHKILLPSVSIIITRGAVKYQVYKPYNKATYKTKQDKHMINVNCIRFFPEDAGPSSLYWGWYADTNCPGTFADEKVAGFRLRKSNIGIGVSDRMTEIFTKASESYARFNKFFMGEIHIQCANVIPNARRDGFENSPEWMAIQKSLIDFARERSREAHKLSQVRNQDIVRLVGAASREIQSAVKKNKIGLASSHEKNKIIEKIDKQISKLEMAKRSDRNEDEIKEIDSVRADLQKTRQTIESKTNLITQNLDSYLDKKQRKIISEIIGILYDVLDEKSFEIVRDSILVKYQISSKENAL